MSLVRGSLLNAGVVWLCWALWMPPVARASLFTGDLVVQSQSPGANFFRMTEYELDGTPIQTIIPERAPASSDSWQPRDMVIGDDGRLYLYNGTFDPYLSIYDPISDAWSHRTRDGWKTVNNVSYGGIAQAGDWVFVTNMLSSSGGVVAFNTALGTSTDFAPSLTPIDLNLGLDGKLWVLQGGVAHAFDLASFAPLGSVSLAAGGSDIRSLAVDATGNFYVASWGGQITRLAPDGSLVNTLSFGMNLTDIDVSPSGLLAVGTWLSGAWLSDTSLSPPVQIESNRWNSFVTFVPEPATLLMVGILGLLAARRTRRA